jgi:hypothetical protein
MKNPNMEWMVEERTACSQRFDFGGGVAEGGFIPGNGGMSNQSVSHKPEGWFGQAEEDERPSSRGFHPALSVNRRDRKRADHRLANSQNPLGPLIQWPRMIADARASFIVVLLNLSGVVSH